MNYKKRFKKVKRKKKKKKKKNHGYIFFFQWTFTQYSRKYL